MVKWALPVVAIAVVAFWIVRATAGDEEGAVAQAIDAVATSDDPAVCTDRVTQAYLEQVTGLPADAAVAACIQTAAEPALQADAVDVSEVTIDGDAATAKVTYDGTTLNGSTLEVGLVRADGEWLLDQRIGFESLDRSAVAEGVRAVLAEPPTDLSAAGAECATERLMALSKAGLESALISADTTAYSKAIIVCDRAGYLDSLAADLAASGYPDSLVECIRAELDRGSDDVLVALLGDPVAYTRVAIDCDRESLLGTYGDQVVAAGASRDAGDCIVSRYEELSDAEIARTAVDAEEIDRVYAQCGVG